MTPDLLEFNRRALDPSRSIVIEASAGSGKTWLLVARILRLLLSGVPPGQILAVTFTRKAAQEMAARLRAWLFELALAQDDAALGKLLIQRGVPAEEVAALLPRARALYEEALTAQPPLTIATFHSLFLQWLKRAPFDAGALGDANLIERTAPLVEDAWQRFAAAMQLDSEKAAARGLDELFADYGLDSTRRLLLSFLRHRAEWWAYTRHTPNAEAAIDYALEQFRASMRVPPDYDVCAALFADGTIAADLREFAGLLARNTPTDQVLAAGIESALAKLPTLACFELLTPLVFTDIGESRQRRASGAQVRRLGVAGELRLLELHESSSARLLSARRDLADQRAYRTNQAGLPAGVALLDAYERIKEERQAIDFADVEWRALQLLSSGDQATFLQYKLDARYRHVLLDEFQDTNPLQWLTLDAWFKAAADAEAGPVIFMVGDPKQSIYRFRGAETRLFDRARTYLAEQFGADADLKHNVSRRCPAPVIALVNQTFTDQSGFDTHVAYYGSKRGRVEVLPLIGKGENARHRAPAANAALELRDSLEIPFAEVEDRRREEEAAALAVRLNSIVGSWELDADAESNTHVAQFKDVMILIRTRTHVAIYERALLRAGIPFVTSGRGGLLDTLEVRDMLALLQFLVSPFADLPLAQALRAPLFACSDQDLIALARTRGGTWWERLQRLVAEPGTGPGLVRAERLLASWLARADALPVHDQLDRIYFEADVIRRYQSAVSAPMRASVAANLHAFMQRALDTGAGRYPSLPRFIHELIDMGAAPSEEAPDEGIIGDPGNAVRILTVHAVKGLEAPIVCLVDTGAQRPPEPSYDVIVDWQPGTDAPAHFSLWTRKAERSARQEELAAAEAELIAREDTNLLYVAMTRAQQVLIVSGVEGSGAVRSWHARVRDAAALLAGKTQAPAGTITLGDEFDRAFEGVQGDLFGSDLTRPETAHAQGPLNAPLPTGVRHAGATGRGQRYGSNFHRVLEVVTSSESPAAPLRDGIRDELGLDEREFAPLWDQAQRLLASSVLARFFDRRQYARAANEVAYVGESGEIFRIDRLVEFDDEVWVLDYKTGARDLVDAERIAQYQTQVRQYRDAVKLAFPRHRVHAAIVFADASTLEVAE